MKFREYINEKYINTNKEYFFLLDGRLPLAPKLWSRISEVTRVPLAWHVTDPKGAKVVLGLQGKNKQISVFTRSSGEIPYGIETKGGILLEMSGDSTLVIDGDAWTSLDRNGLRWWDLTELYYNARLPELERLKFELQDITYEVL